MEPLVTGTVIAASAYLVEKTVSFAEDKFGEYVIKRWTRHRANEFFKVFLAEVAKADGTRDTSQVDQMLDEMMANETTTELLFDAYRRASFAASKTLGPRVIALLTAKLTSENRRANSIEDKVFMAAELLSDSDFEEFVETFRSLRSEFEIGERGELKYLADSECFAAESKFTISSSVDDLEHTYGSWATKLRNIGMVSQHLEDRQMVLADEHPVFMGSNGVLFGEGDTVRSIRQWIRFSKSCELLAEYVERVSERSNPGPEAVS